MGKHWLLFLRKTSKSRMHRFIVVVGLAVTITIGPRIGVCGELPIKSRHGRR